MTAQTKKARGLLVLSFLTVLLFLIPSRFSFADMVGYTGHATITEKSDRFTAVHFHDWSDKTRKERNAIYFDINHHERIFSPEKNHFAYLKLFEKTSGKMVFRAPVPALTYLWISPDGKFVVGLSQVMLQNPYQLVVFTTDGKQLYKEHISSKVAVMTHNQLEEYYQKFPQAKEYLEPRTRTIDGKNSIDGLISGMPNRIGDNAFLRLLDFSKPNPYSPNFGESVTNWVFWFHTEFPQPEIREENGATYLWLNDRKGERFPILLNLEPRDSYLPRHNEKTGVLGQTKRLPP